MGKAAPVTKRKTAVGSSASEGPADVRAPKSISNLDKSVRKETFEKRGTSKLSEVVKAAAQTRGSAAVGKKARKKAKKTWAVVQNALQSQPVSGGAIAFTEPPPTKATLPMMMPVRHSKAEAMELAIEAANEHGDRVADVAARKNGKLKTAAKAKKLSPMSQVVLAMHRTRQPVELPDFLFAHLKK